MVRIVVEIELEDGHAGEFDIGIDIGIASAFSDSRVCFSGRQDGWFSVLEDRHLECMCSACWK
jgi:hypothetical protein